MSFFKAMNISSSGLAAQRMRMNVASANLANAQATDGDDGPYKRRDVVFSAVPTASPFSDMLSGSHENHLNKVKVVGIHEDTNPPREVYDPGHPHADDNGIVKLPNINIMTEMVNMITATRSFEANATALDDSKQMALTALQIGR